jgi:cytochrome oxidase Cu insertion factor (SCO1/SenC/PrrC family)
MHAKAILSASVLTIGAIVFGACAAGPATRPAATSQPGAAHWQKMFPDGLIDAEGKAVSVKALSGKMVGVYFSFRACENCKVVTPKLAALRGANAANFEVVFVSLDPSKEEQRKYMAEEKMKWLAMEWHSDASIDVMKQFGLKTTPLLVILGSDGREVTRAGHTDLISDANSAMSKWQKAAAAPAK